MYQESRFSSEIRYKFLYSYEIIGIAVVEVPFIKRLFCSGFSHQGTHSKDFILALIEINIVPDHVTGFNRVFDIERCISGGMMASEDRALFDARHLVNDMLIEVGFGAVSPP